MCYRTGTSGAGCTGGSWTDNLQWKAKSAASDGSTWSEKVVYAYWPDGTVQTATYRGACTSSCSSTSGEVRRVERSADNAFHQQTYTKLGDSHLTTYRGITQYNGAGDVTAVGLSYNDPPDFCGSLSSVSSLCTTLTRDRMGRITQTVQPPSASTSYKTNFGYDAQGNLNSVQMGCTTGTCTQPSAGYQYDDFGNVAASTLPWTDNGSGAAGVTNFEYDSAQNLVKKQTPGMVDPDGGTSEWLVYAYDSLSRETSETRTYNSGSGTETLVTWSYDQTATPDTSCPSTSTSHTNDRLQMMQDSFGKTWYTYDELGRLTGEVRERTGTTSCSSTNSYNNPNTSYAYTANGGLASIVYPYGRTVVYGYGTGALADRVSSINVTAYDGTSWADGGTVIQGIAWEPYGSMRGYEIDTDGGKEGVEYMLGDDGTVAPTGCPTSAPSTGSSDHTGYLRALWVTGGAFSAGSPSTSNETYRRVYTWQGDQVKEIDSCLLSASSSQKETYSYDRLLRLASATGPLSGTIGGPFTSRTYTLDARSNLTSLATEDQTYGGTYGSSTFPDRLTSLASGGSGKILAYNYTYSHSGNVASKASANDSSGSPALTYSFVEGPGVIGSGASETVFRAIGVNGSYYNYYYDGQTRRRLKAYPAGDPDEFFYDPSNQMLEDQGNLAQVYNIGETHYHPVDDYGVARWAAARDRSRQFGHELRPTVGPRCNLQP